MENNGGADNLLIIDKMFGCICAFCCCALILLTSPMQGWAATHTVAKGESLYQISKTYGIPVETIKKNNGIQGNTIYPGQTLLLNNAVTYQVASGDSLFLIAQRYGITVGQLQSANHLANTQIHPGQILYIPTTGGGQAVSRGNGIITRSDVDLLARIISAEADSESYETKVAVGAVVLNRVESEHFPNTIREVVYHVDELGKYQFEPVLNGWINQPASASAQKAAQDALNGWDPTNGALYFFESWVPNQFLQNRSVSRVMDSFIFSY